MAYLRKQLQDGTRSNGLLGGYIAQQQGPFGAAGGVSGSGAQGSGPTTSGHINFDSIYAANQDTANHMANQLGNQVQGDVSGAEKGLQNLQQAYGADLSKGEGTGPTDAERKWAQYGSTNVQQPGTVESAYWAPQGSNTQSYVQTANPGLQSESTKGGGRTSPSGTHGLIAQQQPTPIGDYEAQVRAGAGAQYNGPDSLQQMKGYQGLLDQYTKTGKELGTEGIGSNAGIQGMLDAQNAGPYIEGGSRLDAALTGQSGRPAFAQLQQQNKNFSSQLGNANTASIAQSQAAREKAKENASGYQGLLDQYTGRQSADQRSADTQSAANANKIAQDKSEADAINQQNGTVDPNDPSTWGASQWIRNIGGWASPLDDILHATGNKGLIDYGTDYFENNFGPIGGQYSQQDTSLQSGPGSTTKHKFRNWQ